MPNTAKLQEPFQAGVVRQPNGRIIKHLKFTQPGQLSPANIESITSDLNAFASTLQLEHIHLHVEDGPTWIEAAGKAVDDTGKALQNARQQTAHAVQDVGNAIAKGAQGTGAAVARGMQDAGNQAAHIAQDAGDAIAKGAQDAGAGIADGVQQFGKGIADGLKQLPEIKLTKFGWGKK